MRLSWALMLGAAAVGAHAADVDFLEQRQATGGSPAASPPTLPPSSSAAATGGGGGSSPSAGSTSTVTQTTTVTGGGSGVTSKTTVYATVTTTVDVTHTEFTTKTVTSSNADTATKTVYVTSTAIVQKRDIIDSEQAQPRDALPAAVDAMPTGAVLEALFFRDEDDHGDNAKRALELPNIVARAGLEKRAVITVFDTVTVAGSGSTIVDTVSATTYKSVNHDTTITNTITETDQVNAKTTVTVTSTLVVTSTSGSPSVTTPTSGSSTSGSSGSSSSSSSGLSTGAKAGIGVGAAVGGLALLGILVWLCVRSRRRDPKPDHDDFMGASEVPVGGPSRNSQSMSQTRRPPSGGNAFLAPGRSPVSHKTSPEGYRGTAMGDGRAGYAKPEPYGAAYTTPSTNTTNRSATLESGTVGSGTMTSNGGADYLPEHTHPGASEMDGTNDVGRVSPPRAGAVEMSGVPAEHRPEVPSNVYEMA
jgi:hypothetical protein